MACYDGWVATFYMYLECSPVPFTLFLPVFLWGCFPLASSPGPTRKWKKGLVTLAQIPVCTVLAVFVWSRQIMFAHYILDT